ncbi:MAG: hypothetical protein V1779_16175 [bacterium]
MKKYIIIILLFVNSNLFAEIEFDFNGYIYDLPSYQKVPDTFKSMDTSLSGFDNFVMNITRLRFRPNVKFGETGRLTLHYEMDALITKFNLPYFGSYKQTNRQVVDLNWKIANEEISSGVNIIANHFIDMLYYKHFFDWGEVVLGRQVIAWGVGRVWQPTDLFNPLNPANFSKTERDGADALSSKIFIGDFTDLELVANFSEKIKNYNYGARFRTNYEEYDLSATAGYFDHRAVIGGYFAGNLFDAGFRGEAIYSMNEQDADSNYIRGIIGLDYQFPHNIYAMIEYQYNGEGTLNKNEYLNYFARLMNGEIQNVSRNYLAIMSSYQIHPLVSSSLMSITNLNDGSGMLGLSVGYNALQDLNLGLGTMFFYGGTGTEYSFYAPAFYLSAEYFF